MSRFELNYNNTKLKERRIELRHNVTEAEKILWEHLRKNKIQGFKFRRQFSIGAYVIDFYCPVLKLAIELDGSIHQLPDNIDYDENRQNELQILGVSFLRFANEDVFKRIDYVLNKINQTVFELSSEKTLSPYQGVTEGEPLS